MNKLSFLAFFLLFTGTITAQNLPAVVPTSRLIPTGPTVFGIFAGRCPCQEIATLLKVKVSPECFKSKWELTLYHDPQTHQPTTFQLAGTTFRAREQQGKWRINKGVAGDTEAIVYELEMENNAILQLLKADDNLLFVLNQDSRLLVGNELFSYTLNRIEKVPQKSSN